MSRHYIRHELVPSLIAIAVLIAVMLGTAAVVQAVAPRPSWGKIPTQTQSHFYRAWLTHRSCGRPLASEHYRHQRYEQRFLHCLMWEGPVRVHRTTGTARTATPAHPVASATPTIPALPPTQPPVPPTASATPTRAATPTAPPLPPPPTSVSTPSPVPTDPQAFLLQLLNADRAQYGVAPLTLDAALSNGSGGTCISAYAHSVHMAAAGGISHDQFGQTCAAIGARTWGQNVGEAGYGNELTDIAQLDQLMMAETSPPKVPGCSGSHACNIINPGFARVGIGLYESGGATWLTEDFAGGDSPG